jgi:hypothetical protein
MPRSGQKSLTLDASIIETLKAASQDDGYGQKGLQKFLRRVLAVRASLPFLFRKF